MRAGRSVVYIDLENGPHEILTRLLALGLTTDEIDGHFLYVAPTVPIARWRDDVRELIEKREPSLVVIDSYTGSLALNDCDPDRAVDVERHARDVLAPLRASGAAVVLIDHVVKNREARGRYSIASERKVGIADVHLGFEVVVPFSRGRRGAVKLVTHKDRHGWMRRPLPPSSNSRATPRRTRSPGRSRRPTPSPTTATRTSTHAPHGAREPVPGTPGRTGQSSKRHERGKRQDGLRAPGA